MIILQVFEEDNMTEQKALDAIYALPRFAAASPSLDPMKELMRALGHPERRLRFIHVAGTNGKGSTATMIAAVLEEAGLRVGLYTSPYINYFRERFRINGRPINSLTFSRAAKRMLDTLKKIPARESISQFDAVTAIGFLLFSQEDCDIVVLECGLGGRLDATNVIPPPDLAVITNIGYDHTAVLGEHITEITAEKCGILKEGTPAAVFSPQDYPEALAVLTDSALERGIAFSAALLADIKLHAVGFGFLDFTYDGFSCRTSLAAPYQAKNAATAIEAIRALNRLGYAISDDCLRAGLLRAAIPARLELLSITPTVVLDGAHNKDGIAALTNSLEILSPQFDRLICIVGMLRDKDPREALLPFFSSKILRKKLCTVATFPPASPRAADAEEMRDLICELVGEGVSVTAYEDGKTALRALLPTVERGDLLLCFGSLYSMGELRREVLSNT